MGVYTIFLHWSNNNWIHIKQDNEIQTKKKLKNVKSVREEGLLSRDKFLVVKLLREKINKTGEAKTMKTSKMQRYILLEFC